MQWSQHSMPAMRLEARFGDRVVPAFCDRPKSIWAMVAEAAARNPDGEALVCGSNRMTWREAVARSAQIAAGFDKLGLKRGDRVVAQASHDKEEILIGEVDLRLLEDTRRNWPFLRDRRIDSYGSITSRLID